MFYYQLNVGGGAAGLSCALEASAAGAHVTLFEKLPKVGGNSAKASSGINGCLTEIQASKGVTTDSYEIFEQDTLKTANQLADPALVNKLVYNSSEAILFLKGLGLPLADIIQLGGHSAPRTHRLSTHAPIGFMLVNTLKEEAMKRDNIAILTGNTVTSLLWEEGVNKERAVSGGASSDHQCYNKEKYKCLSISNCLHIIYLLLRVCYDPDLLQYQ